MLTVLGRSLFSNEMENFNILLDYRSQLWLRNYHQR